MLARELLSISIVESSEGAAGTGPEFPASATTFVKLDLLAHPISGAGNILSHGTYLPKGRVIYVPKGFQQGPRRSPAALLRVREMTQVGAVLHPSDECVRSGLGD